LIKTIDAVASDPTAVFFRLPVELITAVGEKVAGFSTVST